MSEDIFLAVERNRNGSIETGKRIHETVARLPKAAQEIARSIRWVSIGDGLWGLAETVTGPIVILSDSIPDEDFHGIIAHEIAHHLLHAESGATVAELAGREAEAASMARAWGFTGAGCDVGSSVADGLGGLWRYRVQIDEGIRFEGLPQYERWEAGWGLRSAALWDALESSLSKSQAQILADYWSARSEASICRLWARGEGGKLPKPPPKSNFDVLTR